MYRDVKHCRLSLDEIRQLIESESKYSPNAKRIFLADGDVMQRPYEDLKAILEMLNNHFPRLARVNTYANGSSIEAKSEEELRASRGLR